MEGTVTEDGWKSYSIKGADCPVDRGYIYNQNLDWCYRLVTEEQRKPVDAMDFCRLDGGQMIRVNSIEKQQHITDFLRSRESNTSTVVWIGGRSENKDNNFVYEDGTILTFTYWDNHSPDGKSYIRMQQDSNYHWRNGSGKLARIFLCEI
ncbi:alpha-N-acetylgalactosamine-specific lectin-like [Ylistrum balloti]|uniref:alpha-N-acetylgalactosamine-specific lectin-like n=1 Tax=Ylistrum balloti TaxID=509963 RepID=UPI002905D51D|nr:alpha-N-acetylgalactosamine-specific lectin-like [Ylistrum balloti]